MASGTADEVEAVLANVLHVTPPQEQMFRGAWSTLCGLKVPAQYLFDQVSRRPDADVCGVCARMYSTRQGYPLKGGGRRIG